MNVMKPHNTRSAGIDLGRVLGCFFIILLHQSAADYGAAGKVSDILDQLARWAVPFFFIMTGYFTRFDTGPNAVIQRSVTRIVPLYLFWLVLYITWADQETVRLADPVWLIGALIYGGPGFHLWFLPSLVVCVSIAAILLHIGRFRVLLATAGALYLIGLALGSYETVVSSDEFIQKTARLNTRSGPFFGLIFIAMGAWLRAHPIRLSIGQTLLVVLAGIALSNVEALSLLHLNSVPYIRHDFLFGTLLTGFGSAVLFTTVIRPNGIVDRAARALGPVTFGIYAVHLIVLRHMTTWIEPQSLLAGIGVAILVFVASSALALLGSHIPVL